MKVIDPGHTFELDTFDRGKYTLYDQELRFMKREGPGYPGNVGTSDGTNCQEVLRVLIARVKYLQNQIPCQENIAILYDLRHALCCFEQRAMIRHGIERNIRTNIWINLSKIEEMSTCKECGHIYCLHNQESLNDRQEDTNRSNT